MKQLYSRPESRALLVKLETNFTFSILPIESGVVETGSWDNDETDL